MPQQIQDWFWHNYAPKSLLCLREHYGGKYLRQDVLAGITVGAVALPLAMAFAIASGVSPERGLFTAIVAGLLISVLSGSRYQIGGPTGAFVVVVSGIIAHHGLDGLYMCTLLAGILLVVMGVTGMGARPRERQAHRRGCRASARLAGPAGRVRRARDAAAPGRRNGRESCPPPARDRRCHRAC